MMNVSGVGVNNLLKASVKSNVTNAVAYNTAAAASAVNPSKIGSMASKAWNGIKDLGIAAWEKGIKPAAQWVWNKALKPAGELVWNKAIKPAGEFIWNKALKPAGELAWNKAIKPAGQAIAKAGMAVWTKVIKPAGQAIAKAGVAVWDKAVSIGKKIIGKAEPVKDAVSNAAENVMNKGGEVAGAVKNMPKGAKAGLIAAGVAIIAAGIGLLIKNHNAKQAEQAAQAEAV